MVITRLTHPNIVHVIDRGTAGNRYYFVMEYVDGTSLREVIDSERVPMKTKIEMLIQVCKALDYAHKNGVIVSYLILYTADSDVPEKEWKMDKRNGERC